MTPRRPPKSVSADDLLTTLGRLTARVRAGAEMQQARVELAEALQREMLPAALPALPGLRSAARYVPARHGLDIGGDWYDGFPLPEGALAFSIGDVQGHDVEAAAFMGQVRVGLRAVSAVVEDPGEVLSRANDVLLSLDCELFATCTLLRFDPETWELESARAGHVPSVWATVDGRYGITDDEGGLPLGVEPGAGYAVTRRRLDQAGSIVLLTDGVVEGPSFPIDVGLARVARVVREAAGADPDEIAAEIMKVADSTGHADDAAVLVLSHDAAGPPRR
ncbi:MULTISPECIES: PP2C family protein-serine/threonine phosphatase [unclassified Streptomyces]|uniref:PP2C family protein-serine/threonine phosphatase n=1 Tax=unclassified Streptomyces TaxID=2593676 RepID=UPI002254F4A5|nr:MULTISPECIES: PP2C family protein-serine/threonine phosphatase [unclassified Streptomyces]MCX5149486.1 serine/threonine-protein phosphatase [Streptomyces sp. NBC_00320]WSN52531.1 PP2C family protein-serine/threonine phosphatase [Streptomyces sp. NBC_01296]WSW57959.1 serine/threonine-protein phosphatase [Streptomyces sp. NBC_00998]